jgi:hypothetical protein
MGYELSKAACRYYTIAYLESYSRHQAHESGTGILPDTAEYAEVEPSGLNSQRHDSIGMGTQFWF